MEWHCYFYPFVYSLFTKIFNSSILSYCPLSIFSISSLYLHSRKVNFTWRLRTRTKALWIRKRKIDRETLTIFRNGHFERPINIHEVPPPAARVPRTTFDILVVKLERNQSKKFLWCRAPPTNKKRTSSGSHGVIFQRSRQREIRHWGSSYRVYCFSFFFFCHFLEQRVSHCPSNLESKSLNDLWREKDSLIWEF